jgi:hypothetical protein
MALWEKTIECPVQVVDLLNLLIGNILINDFLSLDTCLNVKLGAEIVNITSIFWAASEEFEG